MDAAERARLIGQYRDGYRSVMDAMDGITDGEVDRSAEGGWTPRQIAHHHADSEMVGATRIRFLVALHEPTIQGYDEAKFAARFPYDGPIEPSLEIIRLVSESTLRLIDTFTEEDWDRAGTHSERGRFTPDDWLRLHAPHAQDHAAQIRRARGRA